MSDLNEKAKETLKGLDQTILAIMAKAAYKYRQYFKVSDHELDLFVAERQNRLKLITVSLLVAEQMLQEPPPSIHPRWDEYNRRRTDLVTELEKK
jgi:hypothetical protein